jgi:hypothetical protein
MIQLQQLIISDIDPSPVYTKTPKAPGKIFLKAVLFDTVSVPTTEVFINKQYQWVTIEQGEKQA